MKIIIPMTGLSSRFKSQGIETPKQFLKIGNKLIIQHIIDMFPNEKDINFIVNKADLKNKMLHEFYDYLSNYHLVEIEHQKTGPGGAILHSKILETDSPVIINYCDFSNIWDWEKFKGYVKEEDPDGVVPAYKGLHPHSIYGNDYAFIKSKNDVITNIQEKKSFTNDKLNEYASSGSYYFKTGHLAKKYITKSFNQKRYINGEIYISTPYEEMINDGLDVRLYKLDYFFQWGTPEDYLEFLYNLEEVRNVRSKNKISIRDINLLVPAAGEGSRFKEKNYNQSKIFLEVNGLPLIHQIFNSFSDQANSKILLLERDFNKNLFQNKKVDFNIIKEKTAGQAESAYKLVKEVFNSKPILIHSADCILDKSTIIDIGDYDIVVYTKNNYRRAFSQELNYGWINSTKNSISSLSIKKPPKTEQSNVIVGTFLFKNKELFEKTYLKTLDKNKNTNEIHIDHIVETAIEMGLKVKEEPSTNSVMLGTPLEYELFNYMNIAYEHLNE